MLKSEDISKSVALNPTLKPLKSLINNIFDPKYKFHYYVNKMLLMLRAVLDSLGRSVSIGYRNKSDQMQRNVPEYFNLPYPLRTLLQIYLFSPAIVQSESQTGNTSANIAFNPPFLVPDL